MGRSFRGDRLSAYAGIKMKGLREGDDVWFVAYFCKSGVFNPCLSEGLGRPAMRAHKIFLNRLRDPLIYKNLI